MKWKNGWFNHQHMVIKMLYSGGISWWLRPERLDFFMKNDGQTRQHGDLTNEEWNLGLKMVIRMGKIMVRVSNLGITYFQWGAVWSYE